MVNFAKVGALLFSLGLACAQEPLFDTPIELWSAQITPSSGALPGVQYGNGIKVTPDGQYVIATSQQGSVTAFNAFSGEFQWEYNPPAGDAGSNTGSVSQVVFTTPNAATPYMVYTIFETSLIDLVPVTRVIALDMDGDELWVSDALDGAAMGSPVISNDGNYVYLTHNAGDKEFGIFTVLSAATGGEVILSSRNDTAAFAPIGIYHSPVEGNYDDDNGRFNTNDMLMWSQSPMNRDSSIQPGLTFGFQLPRGFTGDFSTVDYFVLADGPRDFQANTAPMLTNQGLSAYYGVSRSAMWCWVGNPTDGRGRFNRGPTNFFGFERSSTFPGESVFATPQVSSSAAQPTVYGGTASTQFVRMNFDLSSREIMRTSSAIWAEARVDPFDRVVYFAERSGTVHQVPALDGALEDIWTFTLGNGVDGNIDLHPNGAVLYAADIRGFITALQVGEIPATPAPTPAPTMADTPEATFPLFTDAPTSNATDFPTAAPVMGDTSPPAAAPVDTPAMPTDAPQVVPPGSSAFKPMMVLSALSAVLCLFL